ncbi:MAG: M1 family metallopeptidase [candidate division WOR-3 bacterium]
MLNIIFSLADFQNFIKYEFYVKFIDSLDIIKAHQTIYYINNSKDTLKHIELNLYANAFRPNSKYNQDIKRIRKVKITELDKAKEKELGYIRIDSCSEKFDTNDMFMKVYKTILPGETAKIEIKFTLKIPKLFDRLGKDEEEYEITQWYPKVGVYDERGWRTYGYRYNTEFYGDYADWEVHIEVPKNYIIGASGYLIDSTILDSIKVLHFKLEKAHDFAFVMSKRYKVRISEFNNIKIYTLYYSNDTLFAKLCEQHAINSLKMFSNYLYPYPYKTLTIVESHLRAGGGMEYPALILITNPKSLRRFGSLRNFMDIENLKEYYTAIVVAHEVGHQWFYGIIGNDEAYEAWMDEGMNSYLESYYNQNYFSLDSIYKMFGKFSKIMKFYLNNYDFRLFSDYFVYLNPYDEPMLGKPAWEMKNYWQVYNRGKNLMYALKDIMGDSLFDLLLKEYFKEYAFKHPRSEDFFNLAEKISHLDLKEFQNQWLYSKGLPNYGVYKIKEGTFLIKGTYNYPISALIDNKIIKVKPDTIIKANSIILDPFNRTLEIDEWDNTYPRRFEIKPFFTIPKMGYYQISFIPIIFYNPLDNYFFALYLNGSESYKRHFLNYGGNTKGEFYLKFSENYFNSKIKFVKGFFSFETGIKTNYIKILLFNQYINNLEYLDSSYFEKINNWGFDISLKYKYFKSFLKLARDFNKNENYFKFGFNYKNQFLDKIHLKLSYQRILGNYPIIERIYIDGGFLYPDIFEILLPYSGSWFYSKYIVFNDGIYSKRGENIYFDEFILGDIKFSIFPMFGIYSTIGYTNKIYYDYGIYLKVFKLECRIFYSNKISFIFRL